MWQPLITKHSTQRGQIQSFKSRREGLGLYKTSLISYIQLILLGKESVVCTEQPHSWKELHNINQGGPVWSSCFLEKLEEAQEETLGFVYLLLMYTKKKLPDCFMLLLGVFLLCHWWFDGKKGTYFWYCILKPEEYGTAPLESTPNS